MNRFNIALGEITIKHKWLAEKLEKKESAIFSGAQMQDNNH